MADDEPQTTVTETKTAVLEGNASMTGNGHGRRRCKPLNTRPRNKMHECTRRNWDDEVPEWLLDFFENMADGDTAEDTPDGFKVKLKIQGADGHELHWRRPTKDDPKEYITFSAPQKQGFTEMDALAMDALARARGWHKVTIADGTEKEREMMWLIIQKQNLVLKAQFEAAQAQGEFAGQVFQPLEAQGFTPSPNVLNQWKELEKQFEEHPDMKRLREIAAKGKAATGPSLAPAPEEEKPEPVDDLKPTGDPAAAIPGEEEGAATASTPAPAAPTAAAPATPAASVAPTSTAATPIVPTPAAAPTAPAASITPPPATTSMPVTPPPVTPPASTPAPAAAPTAQTEKTAAGTTVTEPAPPLAPVPPLATGTTAAVPASPVSKPVTAEKTPGPWGPPPREIPEAVAAEDKAKDAGVVIPEPPAASTSKPGAVPTAAETKEAATTSAETPTATIPTTAPEPTVQPQAGVKPVASAAPTSAPIIQAKETAPATSAPVTTVTPAKKAPATAAASIAAEPVQPPVEPSEPVKEELGAWWYEGFKPKTNAQPVEASAAKAEATSPAAPVAQETVTEPFKTETAPASIAEAPTEVKPAETPAAAPKAAEPIAQSAPASEEKEAVAKKPEVKSSTMVAKAKTKPEHTARKDFNKAAKPHYKYHCHEPEVEVGGYWRGSTYIKPYKRHLPHVLDKEAYVEVKGYKREDGREVSGYVRCKSHHAQEAEPASALTSKFVAESAMASKEKEEVLYDRGHKPDKWGTERHGKQYPKKKKPRHSHMDKHPH